AIDTLASISCSTTTAIIRAAATAAVLTAADVLFGGILF
ncbi:hypothetical protein Tco_0584721, partial [Tanacetum coccineum]